MAVVFSIFATVAFAWTIVHGVFSFLRWLREPTFDVLNAYFTTEKKGEGLWVVKRGVITVVGYGGARTRKIVNWRFMLFRRTPDGRGIGVSMDPVTAQTLETIPAHESTKFTLQVESGMGLEKQIPERLTGELYLLVDKYWTPVNFSLHSVSGGNFHLDRPIEDEVPWMTRAPWWKRVAGRLQRLV